MVDTLFSQSGAGVSRTYGKNVCRRRGKGRTLKGGGVGEVSGSLGGDLARDLRVEGKGEIDLLARLHREGSGKL